MTSDSNKMTGNFEGKPQTQKFFSIIKTFVDQLGHAQQTIKGQVSFSVKRKFLWLWVYEKTADGTLYLNVCLDKKITDPHFHAIYQVSANRWNHNVVLKSEAMAQSAWLHQLIKAGYQFAQG